MKRHDVEIEWGQGDPNVDIEIEWKQREPNLDDEHAPSFKNKQLDKVRLGSFRPPVRTPRAMTIHSGPEIKGTIRQAVSAFLVSHDKEEFDQDIDQINDTDTCHEIPKVSVANARNVYRQAIGSAFATSNADCSSSEVESLYKDVSSLPRVNIVISIGLDCSSSQRVMLSDLLRHLVQSSRVSPLQMQFAFARLFNRLQDLTLDVPNAAELLREFLRRAVASGYCDSLAAENMSEGADTINVPEVVARIRPIIASIIGEYLASENDVEVAIASIKEMDAPEYGHEFVKRLVNTGLDRSNRDREAVSLLLAAISTSKAINQLEIEKAFQSLLDGLEDVIDDVPDVVNLMSSFIARAISDEVLPPSYATRSILGLAGGDLGKQAVEGAQLILSVPSAGLFLDAIWHPSSPDLKDALDDICSEYLSSVNTVPDQDHPAYRVGSTVAFGPAMIQCLIKMASAGSDDDLVKARQLVALLPAPVVAKGLALTRAVQHPDLDEAKLESFATNLPS